MTTTEDAHLPNELTPDSMANCIHVTVEMYARALARAERAEVDCTRLREALQGLLDAFEMKVNYRMAERRALAALNPSHAAKLDRQ